MNETCVVTIADIYGAEWWERNKAELDREWEWGFGVEVGSNLIADKSCVTLQPINGHLPVGPRIILHRRRPKPPTLREVYGADEVTIPVGWEWTWEWRNLATDDWYIDEDTMNANQWVIPSTLSKPRLILRERPKKVWFRCEAEPRVPRSGDWFYSYGAWGESTSGGDGVYLCATRHEEVDQTVQVVTQEDIDACVR